MGTIQTSKGVRDMTEAETYEARVTALEEEGLTRSDAQAVVEAEDMMAEQAQ